MQFCVGAVSKLLDRRRLSRVESVFYRSLIDNFALALSIVMALVIGKFLDAEISGRLFKYPQAARLTVWSLTLPQVAATLAATLVGFKTFDPGGHRLIDDRILNAVFVLMLSTSILGPVMTQFFTPKMLRVWRGNGAQDRTAA